MRNVNETPLIVSTRAEEASGPFARALSAAPARLWSVPTTTEVAGPDVEPFRKHLKVAKEFDWVVFTSRRAVDAVARLPEAVALDPRHRRHPRIAAVGPVTADRVRAFGFAVDLQPEDVSAASLARAIIAASARLPNVSVLWPRAVEARRELARELVGAGVHLTEAALYSTSHVVPPDLAAFEASLRAADVAAVCFFAPSAAVGLARALGGNLRALQHTIVASVGPTTSAALRELATPPVAEASTPDGASLALAVLRAVQSRAKVQA